MLRTARFTKPRGPYGTSCTLTGRVLSAVPLLLGYVGMAWRERLALSSYGFGDRGFGIKLPPHEMVRAPGFAPRSSEWQSESLLLTYARIKPKEQTPSDQLYPATGFHGGAFRDFRNPPIL